MARDFLDGVVGQWAEVRPDLDLRPMGTIGRFARVYAHMQRSVEGVLAAHGLQVGEFDVLAALRRGGEPFSVKPSALARAQMLSPAGMTNRLDRLEALGFVERRPDPDDRRSSLIVLTDAGRRVIDAAVTDHVANEARLLASLSSDEQESFDAHLRRLLASFEP